MTSPMSRQLSKSADRDAEAARWVVALADRDADDVARRRFDAWLGADDGNAAAYQRALRLHASIDDIAERFAGDLAAAQRQPRLGWGKLAAGGAGLALAAAVAFAVLAPPRIEPVRPDYATEVAQLREVRLEDGSVVMLGAQTQMEVAFTEDARRVRLSDGEAYFQVAHNEARPFYVEARGALVRVTGTEFEVKATADLVRVSVARGSVEVSEPLRLNRLLSERTHQLGAGEEVVIDRAAPQQIAVVAAPRTPASWREGFLVYDGARLGEVIADANRYSAAPISLADDRLGDLRITGSYPVEQVDAMLEHLDAALPVVVAHQANGAILVTAEP